MSTPETKPPRDPAVAGMFYPGDRDQLLLEVDECLALATSPPKKVRAAISPHAGYIYSGKVAGETLGQIVVPERVVLLGPKHRPAGKQAAVYASGKWNLPCGQVQIDEELAAALIEETELVADDVAHRDEHSLEVQVPFLWRANPSLRIVPVLLGYLPLADLKAIGEGIARAIASVDRENTLLVISTDMSHHIPADQAKKLDFLAIDRIQALDAPGLYETVRKNAITMCGVIPTTTALFAAPELGAREARLVRYANSGEVNGNYSQVVGYAGLLMV